MSFAGNGAAAVSTPSHKSDEYPIESVFVGLTPAAQSSEKKGTAYVLKVSRDTGGVYGDDLELVVLNVSHLGRPVVPPKQILKIAAEDLTNMAIHAPEATSEGDPETPSFVAITTLDNTMRYTGYNKTVSTYIPDLNVCEKKNKKTAPDLSCTPFILIVLHKSHDKTDQMNLAVSELAVVAAHARYTSQIVPTLVHVKF